MEHYEILSLAHKICNVCQKLSKRCPGGLCGNAVRKAKEIYYSQFAKDKKVRANGMREKQMIEVITYEQDRLNYFTDLMEKAQKRYKQLFKKYKDAPYVSEEAQMLSDAGRETHFLGDVVEMLEKGYRKQEWISVEERLPDNYRAVLVACEYTTIGGGARIAIGSYGGGFWSLADADGTHYLTKYMHAIVTHWMELPEAPKMKGGAE
jgi:hypothetical protein